MWLTALIKAILDWLTSEAKKDTKGGDADATPQGLKDRWRKRIEEQEKKATDMKKLKNKNIRIDKKRGGVSKKKEVKEEKADPVVEENLETSDEQDSDTSTE
tara:strand:- start:11245 stop:11550 length:306 start_codon:yes stop_codon:yes gene_type:complete